MLNELTAIGYVIVGLFLLFYCGDKLVDGAVALAEKFKVSPLFIGIAVIGFGTSFPEIIASGTAAHMGKPTIGISNIIGSNIANIALVLGLGLLLMKGFTPNKGQMREYLMMSIAMWTITSIFIFMGQINWMTGAVLLIILFAYLYVSLQAGKSSFEDGIAEHEDEEAPLWKSGGLVLFGLVGLFIGANLAIDGAVDIARALGISERVIGLTLVALGTSLPEIAATFAAARHGNIGLTLGNVAGSNTFNSLAGLGVASMFTPLKIEPEMMTDLMVMIAVGLLTSYLFLVKKPNTKVLGFVLVGCYTAYMIVLGTS